MFTGSAAQQSAGVTGGPENWPAQYDQTGLTIFEGIVFPPISFQRAAYLAFVRLVTNMIHKALTATARRTLSIALIFSNQILYASKKIARDASDHAFFTIVVF